MTVDDSLNIKMAVLNFNSKQESVKDQTDTDLSSRNNDGFNGNAGSVISNDRSLHGNVPKVFPF